ncbi:MAG: tetratricopeptide repeat protein [Candidatus Omnitrophota bacterium]
MMTKVCRRLSLISTLFFLLLFCGKDASAQEDLKNEIGTVHSESRLTEKISKTAAKSEEKERTDKYKTGITYADVLKEPDNIDLNFRYAQEQIVKGRLLGAAATLERILLVNPNLADVRLLYGVVLYRLDNLNEAQRELDALKAVPLPARIKQDVSLYLKKIQSRKRSTHVSVRESLGWGYDTNRNASPSSKFQWFNEVPLATTGNNVRRPDTNFLNVTTVDVSHNLGFQAGHSVFGSFTYFLQEQTNVNSLDLSSFQYEFGGTFKNKHVDFTPSFYASNVLLSREGFLRTQGGKFLFERNVTKRLGAFYSFGIERQDYTNIFEDNNAYNRKGPQIDNFLGINYMLLPTMRWTTSVGYSHKFAKQDYYAYDHVTLNNSHTWILPKGQFLINAINAYFDNYDAPDFAVSPRNRHDKIMRYRVTYGVPLTTLLIGKILPGPLKDTVFTFSYEYYRSLSNITNYSYNDSKLQALLNFRWEY